MDLHLLQSKISNFLSPGYEIVLQSEQTQGMASTKSIILWNNKPCEISEETYKSFQESLKKRGSRFYSHGGQLPYTDFCIALLCSLEYSLNHESMKNFQPRVLLSAWRSLVVISEIADEEVQKWLNEYIGGRSHEGYASSLDVSLNMGFNPIHTSKRKNGSGNMKLGEIIEDASFSGEVVYLRGDYIEDKGYINIPSVSITPEGQLMNLRVSHEMALSKKH